MLERINTPTLLLDEEKARKNIREMAGRAKEWAVQFRPHFKTHQSRMLGEWFREEGVERITVSSLRMARYFADAGWKDITLAFPVNLREIEEINTFPPTVNLQLTVCDLFSIKSLSAQLKHTHKVFIKTDTGYGRAGIPATETALLDEMVGLILKSDHLLFAGFLAHAGHTYQTKNKEQIQEISKHTLMTLGALKERYANQHPLISVGDTPSSSLFSQTGADEIRPGNFVFYDLMQTHIGSCSPEQIAVCLACPVVSVDPRQRKAVLYGGGVHFGKESSVTADGKTVYGMLVHLREKGWEIPAEPACIYKLSQEHALLSLPEELAALWKAGDLAGILPVHSCMTAQAMRQYLNTNGKIIDHMEGSTNA